MENPQKAIHCCTLTINKLKLAVYSWLLKQNDVLCIR